MMYWLMRWPSKHEVNDSNLNTGNGLKTIT